MLTELKLARNLTEEDKMAPQARAIVETLMEDFGLEVWVPRQALIEAVAKSGRLTTRQDVGRIISFYQPKLQEDGLVDVRKTVKVGPTEGEEGVEAPKPKRTRRSSPSSPRAIALEADDSADAK